MIVELHLDIEPESLAINQAKRAAIKGRGKAAKPFLRPSEEFKKAFIDARDAVRKFTCTIRIQQAKAFDLGPVKVTITFVTKRTHRQGPAKGMAFLDSDAPVKAIFDALEKGGLLGDDAQIVEHRVRKLPPTEDRKPGIWVRVETC